MVFSTLVFLFKFLPIMLLASFLIRNVKLSNIVLLLGSLFFYAWGEKDRVVIMLGSIVLNYLFGLWINNDQRKGRTRGWGLFFGIGFNLVLLGVMKYANFIVANFNVMMGTWFAMDPVSLDPIVLPIGISFFTFQSISYLVDVYRRESAVQKNLIDLGLYISLFPQLIAGPIVRYHDVNLQLKNRSVDVEKFTLGVRRFILGLSKKVLIANVLGQTATTIFALDDKSYGAEMAWLAIVCYSLQIFFDFSGYSDMAIGLGKMFGFDFLENFNFPYISQSIQEFWRRWHISLSSWFRDYLYIPLGGNRKGPYRTYFNLLIVFFCTGLWHGASWNFVAWGFFHGFFLILERLFLGNWLKRWWRPLRHMYLLFVVLVGWALFAFDSLQDGTLFITKLFVGTSAPVYSVWEFLGPENLIALLAALVFSVPFGRLPLTMTKDGKESFPIAILSSVVLLILFAWDIMYVSTSTFNPFIYFRF